AGDEIVTYVARNLEPYRGFPTFMRSLPRLLSARPKARVVIVGDDDVSYGRPLPPGQLHRQLLLDEIADGFDRSLVWPLLIAGSISLPSSPFRTMIAQRASQLGSSAEFDSFGRVKELLSEVWRVNDNNLAKGTIQSVHWRDTMQQKGWDFLLI
ncbi:MAG: hypothetical protein M1823_009006, partial [Watsoniomyces obsoletus]